MLKASSILLGSFLCTSLLCFGNAAVAAPNGPDGAKMPPVSTQGQPPMGASQQQKGMTQPQKGMIEQGKSGTLPQTSAAPKGKDGKLTPPPAGSNGKAQAPKSGKEKPGNFKAEKAQKMQPKANKQPKQKHKTASQQPR